jgi:hypothetical protein
MSPLSTFDRSSKRFICNAAFMLVGAWNVLAMGSVRAEPGDAEMSLKLPDAAAQVLRDLISASAKDIAGFPPPPTFRGRGGGMGMGRSNLPIEREGDQSLARFNELLVKLAELAKDDVVGALETHKGRRIECNLVAIALDRQRHPEMYDELLAYYGVPTGRPTVAPERRSLNHTEDRHRLFWEYCTLAPADERMRFIQEGSLPILALSVIQDDRSLPVLGFDFRLQQIKTLLEPGRAAAMHRMETALGTMIAFESTLALEWSLQCVALTESCHPYSTFDFRDSQFQHLANSIGKKELTSFRDLATALLAKPVIKLPHRTEEGWRQILETYPVDQLSASDKSLVKEALSTYELK